MFTACNPLYVVWLALLMKTALLVRHASCQEDVALGGHRPAQCPCTQTRAHSNARARTTLAHARCCTQGGIVLAQNQLSLLLYGHLEGRDMPFATELGDQDGVSEGSSTEGHEPESAAARRLRKKGSGLLNYMFALESPEALKEMLHVSGEAALPCLDVVRDCSCVPRWPVMSVYLSQQ